MTMQNRDQNIVLRGFKVMIDGAGSGSDPDSAWETCSGGSLNIEISDSSTGSDKNLTTTPGHKYVDTLTLRGPLTPGRKWIGAHLNEVARKKDARFTLTIVEVNRDGSDGRKFVYQDCFVTRYKFPQLATDGTGNLYEEVHIKPIRLELA